MSKWFVFLSPLLCAAEVIDPHGAASVDQSFHHEPTSVCDGLTRKKCSAKLGCAWYENTCSVRIAWLHVMRCGSTFGTTLAHFANSTLPDTAYTPNAENMADPEDIIQPGREGSEAQSQFFRYMYPAKKWFTDVFRNPSNPGNHVPILPEEWQEWRHAWFGFFREPASRALSSYEHFGQANGDLKEWGRRIQGQQASMLSNGRSGMARIHCEFNRTGAKKWCARTVAPDVSLAIKRLNHFAFVGILEEFDLSVCLFHKMFGTKCLEVEFMSMRPGRYPGGEEKQKQDLAVLKELGDPWDEPVYKAVTRRFWSDVRKYDLHPSTCKKICPFAPDFKHASKGPHDVFPLPR
eukprot:TRINITY_DN12739_c0_g1_i1.p1 TRINITY_DN12739_c0_g1~~TRINITY_DN12739_c0_g1_i1.p1  ORF type:complete len:349 (+),score=26.99 TRINITY_DN12739_c0_g1_i1:42-1088(+)